MTPPASRLIAAALLALGFVSVLACTGTRSPSETKERPTSAILFIGDGMGVGQISTADIALSSQNSMAMTTAEVTGFMKTMAANSLVTDSAAAATAMATGFKTDTGVIGRTPTGRDVGNLFEAAREHGLATGVITTSGLVDATPAGFTVHANDRYEYKEILEQMLQGPCDLMIGGDFTRYSGTALKPGYLELVSGAESASAPGVTVIRTVQDLEDADSPVIVLLSPREETPEHHGPELAVSVAGALELLSADPDGFLLLVESEVTDEMGHLNDLGGTIAGIAELDRAVAVALDFTEDDANTLVLVTADHDTGGLGVVGGAGPGDLRVRWATGTHTAQWVPVLAWGPGAESLTGVWENTEFGPTVAEVLGFGDYGDRAD